MLRIYAWIANQNGRFRTCCSNLELGFKPYKLAVIIWIMDQVAHGSGKRNLAYSLFVQPSTQQQETISPNPISSNIGNLTEGHHVKSKWRRKSEVVFYVPFSLSEPKFICILISFFKISVWNYCWLRERQVQLLHLLANFSKNCSYPWFYDFVSKRFE